MPRWLKIILKTLGVLVALLLIILVSLTVYISTHKKYILGKVTQQLNDHLNGGTLAVQDIEPSFFANFPNASITLKNVTLRDRLYQQHKHTLLDAQNLGVSVNTMGLLKGDVDINRIDINNAKVYLFTDSSGYTNTSIFKPKTKQIKKQGDQSGGSSIQLRKFSLNQVTFVLDNQKGNKLFYFNVDNLGGKLNFPGSGWKADVNLKVLCQSLAFNTQRGSFLKDKLVQGTINASYDEQSGVITLAPNKLMIGGDDFVVGATFFTKKNDGDFKFDITEKALMWRHASALLAPNIAQKLNMFNLAKPLQVHAIIGGSFSAAGDPSLNISANVDDNTLTTPGGKVDSCSFHGVFTNSFVKEKPLSDKNSAIELFNLKGSYQNVPFIADTGVISNLDTPVISGTFKSKFNVTRLNTLLGDNFNFNNGIANLNISYKANVVDFKAVKPIVTGFIDVKNADFKFIPRNISFKNTSISVNLAGDDLFLKDIKLQSGKSVVFMEASVKNFLNLYYADPAKILINWQIYSPQMYLGEFLGFLGAKNSIRIKKTAASSNFADQLNTVLDEGRADLHMKVDNLHYNHFLATNVMANVLLSQAGINLQNVSLRSNGGSVNLNGNVTQAANTNHFDITTDVNNVNISSFFYSFDNFGMDGFSYQNLRGYLSLKSNIAGNISDQGTLMPRSIVGSLDLNIEKGALIDFTPITNVGKFAFPFRDVNNITFDNLHGNFDIRREKIIIHPMMISSSVLNMNVAGVYSLGQGTSIALDVPLRNPKKDEDITNKKEKRERRMNGIVLHILASDGKDGKVKIGWNSKDHPLF